MELKKEILKFRTIGSNELAQIWARYPETSKGSPDVAKENYQKMVDRANRVVESEESTAHEWLWIDWSGDYATDGYRFCGIQIIRERCFDEFEASPQYIDHYIVIIERG